MLRRPRISAQGLTLLVLLLVVVLAVAGCGGKGY
jgi:predicted small lipoprotein YifL